MNAIIIGLYGSIKGKNSNSSMELCNYRRGNDGVFRSYNIQNSMLSLRLSTAFAVESVASEQQT